MIEFVTEDADLSLRKYTACVDGSESLADVVDDLVTGQMHGVSALPTVVINGKTFAGAMTFAELAAQITKAVSEGRSERTVKGGEKVSHGGGERGGAAYSTAPAAPS